MPRSRRWHSNFRLLPHSTPTCSKAFRRPLKPPPTITTSRAGGSEVCMLALFTAWRRSRGVRLCGSLKSAASGFERLAVSWCACAGSSQTFAYIHRHKGRWAQAEINIFILLLAFFSFFPPVLAPFPRGTDRSVQVELSTETPTSLKVTQKKDEGKAAGRWEETEMELHCQSLKNLKAEMRTRPGSHEAGAELQLWNQFYNLKEKKHFNFYFSDGAFSSTWRRSICKINQKVVTDSLLLGG